MWISMALAWLRDGSTVFDTSGSAYTLEPEARSLTRRIARRRFANVSSPIVVTLSHADCQDPVGDTTNCECGVGL